MQIVKRIKNLLSLIVVCAFISQIQSQDTVKQHLLKDVRIVASQIPSDNKSQTPIQIIDHQVIERFNAVQLSDAVQHLSGVVVKDYGGVGGIKTISARGLGSQFSTLAIDGVPINDCQNGQPDLGRFIIDDLDYLCFTNGQPDDILQTAQVLAASNVLDMKTAKPRFYGKKTNLKLSFEAGSFGLLHPSLIFEQSITKKLSIYVKGTYIQSDGDYPFTIYYTNGKKDSSSRKYRQNADMKMANAEANIFYKFTTQRNFMAKLYYYNALHSLPGPVIYYTDNGSEKTKDNCYFLQMQYVDKTLQNIVFQLNGKIYKTKNIYEDTAYKNYLGYLKNEFEQSEYYFSASGKYNFLKHFNVAYASDYTYNSLISNIEQSSDVGRHSWQNALLLNAFWNKINFTGTLLSNLVSENICGSFAKKYQHFSYYSGFTIKPLNNNDLHFRYFIKETYRIPNFNECYYTSLSKDLQPENALQNNFGITYSNKDIKYVKFINDVSISLDAYYNIVKNKIVAIPRQSLYLWSMQNIGEVLVLGIDTKLEINSVNINSLRASLIANYSFQQAQDITNPDSKTYLQQIPYTPKHSAGVSLFFCSKILDCGYNMVFVGKRYKQAQNTENNLLESYIDQNFIVSKTLNLKTGSLKLQAQVLNIFDVQYEIVKSYPMMGRNFKISITYKF